MGTAKAAGLKEHVMLRKVILPAAMPSIFSGAMIPLILSFVALTVAEMIAVMFVFDRVQNYCLRWQPAQA